MTGLLLTGVTKSEDLADSSIQPDLVFKDLPEFLDQLTEAVT
jgi:ribonucleotide monophosphatase NagD (HAD superfamily)